MVQSWLRRWRNVQKNQAAQENLAPDSPYEFSLEELEDRRVLNATPLAGIIPVEGVNTGQFAIASFTDPNGSQPVSNYTAEITWGDHTPISLGAITYDGPSDTFTVTTSHTYAEEGMHGYRVLIFNNQQWLASAMGVMTIQDAPLVATAQNVNMVEGIGSVPVTVATFTDPAPNEKVNEYKATIDWGDGSTPTQGTVVYDTALKEFKVNGSHKYNEEGSYNVHVTLDNGPDVAPTTTDGTATVGDGQLNAVGGTYSLATGSASIVQVAHFTDPDQKGVPSDYTATITWGDGNTSQGIIVELASATIPGTFTVLGSNLYSTAGDYAVSVKITDAGGSSVTANSQLNVSDLGMPVQKNQVLSVGAWSAGPGNVLIQNFNGPLDHNDLGNWLATTFPNLYGASAGANDLAGLDNTQVATYFQGLAANTGNQLPAELLATALNVYATTFSLGGNLAKQDGLSVSVNGLGASFFNVGLYGVPFGVSNNATVTVGQLLSAANAHSSNGVPFNGDPTLQQQAETVLHAINTTTTQTTPANAAAIKLNAVEGAPSGIVPVTTFTGPVGVQSPAAFSAAINWGDGTAPTSGTITYDLVNNIFTVSGNHTYTSEGSFPVHVLINHGNNPLATASGTATVKDAPLAAIGTPVALKAGSPAMVQVAHFTDADPTSMAGDYTATIAWGNGQVTQGTVSSSGGGVYVVTGSNIYATPGTYAVNVQITDGGGSTATAGSTATVTALNQAVKTGLSGSTGFWAGSNGQALINGFNNTITSTALANWLATAFPNLYGAGAGLNNLTGQANAQVAAYYLSLYNSGFAAQAEVLAAALNLYATTESLGGLSALSYGFTVNTNGLGAYTYNVGVNGLAFNVANNASVPVGLLLAEVNLKSASGVLYSGDTTLQAEAGSVFDSINKAGGIN